MIYVCENGDHGCTDGAEPRCDTCGSCHECCDCEDEGEA
jgi:hypothetical protein